MPPKSANGVVVSAYDKAPAPVPGISKEGDPLDRAKRPPLSKQFPEEAKVFSPFPTNDYVLTSRFEGTQTIVTARLRKSFTAAVLRSHLDYRVSLALNQPLYPHEEVQRGELRAFRHEPINYPEDVVALRPCVYGALGTSDDEVVFAKHFPGCTPPPGVEGAIYGTPWPTLALQLWDAASLIGAERWLTDTEVVALAKYTLRGLEDIVWILDYPISSEHFNPLTHPVNRRRMTQRRFWVLPVNLNQAHWAMAVFDNAQGVLYFADSLLEGRSLEAMKTSGMTTMDSVVIPWLVYSSDLIVTHKDVTKVCCLTVQQGSEYECGFYAVEAARTILLETKIVRYKAIDDRFRAKLTSSAYSVGHGDKRPTDAIVRASMDWWWQSLVADALQIGNVEQWALQTRSEKEWEDYIPAYRAKNPPTPLRPQPGNPLPSIERITPRSAVFPGHRRGVSDGDACQFTTNRSTLPRSFSDSTSVGAGTSRGPALSHESTSDLRNRMARVRLKRPISTPPMSPQSLRSAISPPTPLGDSPLMTPSPVRPPSQKASPAREAPPPPPLVERRVTRGSARLAAEAAKEARKDARKAKQLEPIVSEPEGDPSSGSSSEADSEDTSDGDWEGDDDPRPLFPRTSEVFLPPTVKSNFKGWARLKSKYRR